MLIGWASLGLIQAQPTLGRASLSDGKPKAKPGSNRVAYNLMIVCPNNYQEAMQLIKSPVWPPDLGLAFMDHIRMALILAYVY